MSQNEKLSPEDPTHLNLLRQVDGPNERNDIGFRESKKIDSVY